MADKAASNGITITAKVDKQGYAFHLVQGWQEDGRWQRKQFKRREDAESFAAMKRVEMENRGRKLHLVASVLTEEQHEAARQAFDALGESYTLADAVAFFLRHHRAPDFTIRLSAAALLYRIERERDGLRPKSLHGIAWTLERFQTFADDPWLHEVTTEQVDGYLRSLRARNGKDRASRRSWNLHRQALHAFFAWCGEKDLSTNRPFVFSNPVEEVRQFTARQVREDQAETIATTSPDQVGRLFSVLMRWRGGVLVRPFALLYFAGLRPGELERLAAREDKLINLRTNTITIPASVSKTKHDRQVSISPNLRQWLEAYPGETMPPNFENLAKRLRKRFALSHDEPRHSFISYHVALNRSVGDAALQAGNSEAIVKRHYLNTHPREEGAEFFALVPCPARRRAVVAPDLAGAAEAAVPHLRAV